MRVIILLFCLVSLNLFAQKKSNVFRIDSVPKKSTIIDSGWKWHAGDNPNYAKINFDDSKWDTINTQEPINKLKQVTDAQLGWFRLTLEVDSLATKTPLFLIANQMGASELYLDGVLIRKLGVVSVNPSEEVIENRTYGIPSSIIFSEPGKHTLAVKYSFSKNNYLLPFSINGKGETLVLRIRKIDEFHEKVNDISIDIASYYMPLFGFFVMMCILQIILYLFNKNQKVNLIFAIALLLDSIHFLFAFIAFNSENPIHAEYYQLLSAISVGIYFVLLAYTICDYLQRPKTKIFWVFTIMFFCLMLIYILGFKYKWADYLELAIHTLLFFEVIRQIIQAKKSGNEDAPILLLSMGIMVSTLVLRNVTGWLLTDYLGEEVISIAANFFMISCYVIIPITLCILIAKNNTLTTKTLEIKLQEIEKLSEEKAQILSTQNEYLEKQVNQRTAELNLSLENLKVTQNQLIQSEKLASLGELTAGIAHEIQNPLNFVNNFSELSVELIEELQEERNKDRGERDNELEDELLSDISQNLEKITHHGKRASSIVKGMLEHSRTSNGTKELTDINALADEYLRLSYHGLRAKDKTFNSDFKTAFDENLPKIGVVPQDLGRVLLNLINNAFYAVSKIVPVETLHATSLHATSLHATSLPISYKPTVTISTQKSDSQIIIKIKDNGTGMPEAVKAKIFQPFFTTKPTGQGTGLGLSLSYDIVKAHGGTLEVESEEGIGTTFMIKLPTS